MEEQHHSDDESIISHVIALDVHNNALLPLIV